VRLINLDFVRVCDKANQVVGIDKYPVAKSTLKVALNHADYKFLRRYVVSLFREPSALSQISGHLGGEFAAKQFVVTKKPLPKDSPPVLFAHTSSFFCYLTAAYLPLHYTTFKAQCQPSMFELAA